MSFLSPNNIKHALYEMSQNSFFVRYFIVVFGRKRQKVDVKARIRRKKTHFFEAFDLFFKSQNIVFDPGFSISVKICPRMRSPYAILSLCLVESLKMPTSELELAENTLFFEDFGLV